MQNDDRMKHPGEEHHYSQHPQAGGHPTQYFGAGPGDQYPQPGGYITQNSGAIVDPTPQPGGYVPQIYTDPSGKLMEQPPKRPNPWKATTLVLSVVTVVLLATSAVLVVTRPGGSTKVVVVPTATTASGAQQPTSITATTGTTGATSTPSASTAATPTAPGVSPNNYSAPQPGPGCDTGGATWTPQGISHITCGTYVVTATQTTWGYLYFQLPGHAAFSVTNSLSATGNFDSFTAQCYGLAEQDANTGYLGAFCGTGQWFIYSISNQGTILKTLSSNTTSTRANSTISLTIKNNSLSFAIDSEVHQITIAPFQPVKVALGYFDTGYGGPGTTVTNFSYVMQAS